jgi:hypothetical protein
MPQQLTCEFLDITPFLESGAQPEKLLKIGSRDRWQVRKLPVDFTYLGDPRPGEWSLVRAPSEMVRIPLIPYRTNTMEPHEMLVSAMDMGIRLFTTYERVVRIHIVMGKPVEDLTPEAQAFRYWVGAAIQTS